MIKVTTIFKNTPDYDYTEWFELPEKSNLDRLNKALNYLVNPTKYISTKCGNNSFSDRVDLNRILKSDRMFKGECQINFKLEKRKGYKLATFEIYN